MRRSILATWLVALWLPFTPGCGHGTDAHEHTDDAAAHDHADDHDHADHDHDHVHTAKFGGMLVVLAPEFANVELLLDEATGRVDLWALDAHAENTVKLTQPFVTLEVDGADGAFELQLDAVPSALSLETVGDTSHFAGTDARLAGLETFSGTLGHIRSRGRDFPSTPFTYELEHDDHDHDHE
ncbi:MAG: hypothetical protein R3F34_10840 [Planctomycetota bacterium]